MVAIRKAPHASINKYYSKFTSTTKKKAKGNNVWYKGIDSVQQCYLQANIRQLSLEELHSIFQIFFFFLSAHLLHQ